MDDQLDEFEEEEDEEEEDYVQFDPFDEEDDMNYQQEIPNFMSQTTSIYGPNLMNTQSTSPSNPNCSQIQPPPLMSLMNQNNAQQQAPSLMSIQTSLLHHPAFHFH